MILLGLLACSPGALQWSDGQAELRTAWWQRVDFGGGERIAVALSTSEFPCALALTGDDPAEVTLAQLELHTATCREDARHVTLALWRTGGDEAGSYPGVTGATVDTLAERDRFATAGYYAIDEAGLLYVDGINRAYAPVEGGLTLAPYLGDGGQVEVEDFDGETLGGWFSFPEVDLSGQFRAQECPEGPELLDDLFDTLDLLQAPC